MRSIIISLVVLLALGATAAETAKISKVLPQYLDVKGRSATHPSLFDRDAYQAWLRDNPAERAALRFHVNWKARGYDELTLRVEAKGGAPTKPQVLVLEQKVRPGWFSKWSAFTLSGDEYKAFNDLLGWRATLWNGTNQVAEQKSFLW